MCLVCVCVHGVCAWGVCVRVVVCAGDWGTGGDGEGKKMAGKFWAWTLEM